MRENKKLIVQLFLFFTVIISVLLFIKVQFDNVGTIRKEKQDIVMMEEVNRRNLSNNNNYECDEITDPVEKNARCIVETRTKEQEDVFLEILNNNQQISNTSHATQSRTGFSDGIYGINNFADQYNITGEIQANTVYQYRLDFDYSLDDSLLSEDEYTALSYYGLNQPIAEDEYATLLNPQASYKTLIDAKVADEYSSGLLIGSYPQDESNQVMVSVIVAEQICQQSSECSSIDDLLNQEIEFELVGMLADGSESIITASAQISGIYAGTSMYNDIILAYDGLTEDDPSSTSDLNGNTLIDQYNTLADEMANNQNSLPTEDEEAAAHSETQAMIDGAKNSS